MMTNEENSSALSINNNDDFVVQQRNSTTAITSQSLEIQPVHSMTCSICLEDILTAQKEFGLQNNCDHIFCYDCLSTWRRTSAMVDKDTCGRCPLCRIRSTFIAPSWRCFNDADDKRSIIDAHRIYLKNIKCRSFSQTGYCRFGHRCYYKHVLPFTISAAQRFLSSSPIDLSYVSNETQRISSVVYQWNADQPFTEINEEEDDERDYEIQQEPPRRITFNSYRHRPY